MPLKPDLPPGSTNYSIAVDATNFSADNMIMGQRLDAAALHVTANPQGFQFKGDVKIAGAPATLEYRQARGDSEADIRTPRHARCGGAQHISASIPATRSAARFRSTLTGRVGTGSDRDGRFSVAADLTSAQIKGFLPGWVKPAGKPARATLTLTTKPQSIQHRRSGHRGRRRRRQRDDRTRRLRRAAIGQFPVLRLFRRRQGDAEGRARAGRRAARRHARRGL